VTSSGIAGARSTLMIEIAIAFPLTIALWVGVYYLIPPLAGMADTVARLVVALQCVCVAVLFTFVTGIEAVAHERLRSPGIDPLSGYETPRMTINLRYLQHTLEQLLVFVPGLFGLAYYSNDGSTMRAVIATTAAWIAGRIAFWIGYHRGALHRAAGAPGMALGMLVLLYVSARIGYDIAGVIGALAPLVLFGCAEIILVVTTRPRAL
jgi:hypothetical protein